MYTVREAKANFSKLLNKAANGEEVIIARGKKPVAKLIAFSVQKSSKKRVPGRFKGKISYGQNIFEPMSKADLAEWGIE